MLEELGEPCAVMRVMCQGRVWERVSGRLGHWGIHGDGEEEE